MKFIMHILILSICALVMSCSVTNNKNSFYPDKNRWQQQIVSELRVRLEYQNIKINFYLEDSRVGLATGVKMICETRSHAFMNKLEAENYINTIRDVVCETIQDPKYRLYLDEFPNKQYLTSFRIYFIDPKTGKAPQKPYYSQIGWDGFNIFVEYSDSKEG